MEEVEYSETELKNTINGILDAANQVAQYWRLNANPNIWDMQKCSVGNEQDFTTKKGNKKIANYQYARKGDLVWGYKTQEKIIVSLFVVSQPDNGRQIIFKKILDIKPDYLTRGDINKYIPNNRFLISPQTTFLKIEQLEFVKLVLIMIQKGVLSLQDFISAINSIPSLIGGSGTTTSPALISSSVPAQSSTLNAHTYSSTDFCKEVYGFNDYRFQELKALLETKKNIILQGAPGVGKTYAAKRLAYAIMGEKDDSRIDFVQFHQNYAYENFVMGYKPNNNGGFDLTEGIFYKFCKEAEKSNEPYFFIIDEINRGNLSKIFGELLMLIENNHRKEEVKLAYKDELFSVPENLYIIGMMNTADRSLAMIDYALRRRFSFYDMKPEFDSLILEKLFTSPKDDKVLQVIRAIKVLNQKISDSLGDGFCIGHSYFCELSSPIDIIKLKNIINFDIIPMLKEYWFDDTETFERESVNLLNAL